ncbi:chorismate synthase [Salmonella enterica]
MAGNTIGQLFRVTTFGESHGLALGGIVDGVPPGIPLTEADLQHDLDRRRPGTSRYTTQRREPDQVKILSGVFDGVTTGTSISRSGQHIVAHMALKPTSSITVPGRTINRMGEEVEMITKGRHDPCVGIRAVPIAEAMLAIVLMDHLLRHRAQNADVKTEIPRW